ncbi:MAG: acylneuraminate cytidylyltransferase family protein, partial [Gammaproteobacteria bacterium]
MSSNTISNKNTLAVILARGGSKRIPGKNKRLLNGKPLIAYTFESATSSDCFDKIVLSTDDESIAGIAEEYNIEFDSRPEELAGDETRAVEVIYEFLTRTKAEQSYRYIAMLLPTCPFRTSEDIQNAVNHYKVIADDARPLVSV